MPTTYLTGTQRAVMRAATRAVRAGTRRSGCAETRIGLGGILRKFCVVKRTRRDESGTSSQHEREIRVAVTRKTNTIEKGDG